ncbi:DUF1045 domain-containing protein [Ensifer soli]|uniref:DUF1045 domain-containing protein n=1 Tax=Ciceribacter sp. sgz301302 TaxID=3342379 RepID=UPI0035BAB695
MRYAIYFTPPPHDPLSTAAANWLGRNVYTGDVLEPQPAGDLSIREVAYLTAVPRRYGFHANLKAPFLLAPDATEAGLMNALMRFAGTVSPFEMPLLEVARLGNFFGLSPVLPSEPMQCLAARIVEAFDPFRAGLTDADIERRDPDGLTAPQFSNLHRWGYPYVMDEFRFHMSLTGPVGPRETQRIDRVLRTLFEPLLERPLRIASIALFVEQESGGPMRVHSQHPLGKVMARRSA